MKVERVARVLVTLDDEDEPMTERDWSDAIRERIRYQPMFDPLTLEFIDWEEDEGDAEAN